jgi:hypothetical protein
MYDAGYLISSIAECVNFMSSSSHAGLAKLDVRDCPTHTSSFLPNHSLDTTKNARIKNSMMHEFDVRQVQTGGIHEIMMKGAHGSENKRTKSTELPRKSTLDQI